MNIEFQEKSKRIVETHVYANISNTLYALSDELDISTEQTLLTLCENVEDDTEVFEWWLVSPWLCEKLQAKGEVVIPWLNIWGRQTTGQNCYIDSVMMDIAKKVDYNE